MIPASSARAPSTDGSGPALAVDDPRWRFVESWLTGQAVPRVRGAGDVLDRAPPAPLDRVAFADAWDAYLASYAIAATPDDIAQLASFARAHPHVAQQAALLAAALADAKRERDVALSGLNATEWFRMSGVLGALASGDAHVVPPEDLALLQRVDLARMIAAAAVLDAAAARSETTLPQAARLDAQLATALPPAWRSPDADPAAILAGLAAASPVTLDADPNDALAAYARATGAPVPPRLPAPLASALASLLAASLRQDGSPGSGRALLATLAQALPDVERAGHDLSLLAPGALDALAGEARALQALRTEGTMQPLHVLADVVGAPAAPPEATLAEGLARWNAALGLPPAPSIDVARAEAALGPDLAARVGSLLAAAAQYQADLAPGSPVVREAAAAREAALAALAGDGPLTAAERAALQRDVRAQHAYRETAARDAGALLVAATRIPLADPAVAPTEGVVFRGDSLVILGTSGSLVTPDSLQGDPAIVIDLGGDDEYRAPVAGIDTQRVSVGAPVGSREARVSIAIDLGGNDRYHAVAPFTLGAARSHDGAPVLGLLLDATGHDQYHGANMTLGVGVNAFGFALDASGNDAWTTGATGLGAANTTTETSIAIGMLVDASGDDSYDAREGYARLLEGSAARTTGAVFLDLDGKDSYRARCPVSPREACFARPRASDDADARGVAFFLDGAGDDEWPRPDDPAGAEPIDPGLEGALGDRFALALDDPVKVVATTVPDPAVAQLLSDADGDHVFDWVEDAAGTDPSRGPDTALGDADEDGAPDALEALVGTDPHDADSRPAQLPSGGVGGDGLLVDFPGLLGVGLPGRTNFTSAYSVTLDLGTDPGAAGSDAYRNRTAVDGGVSLDLAGNDSYVPKDPGAGLASAGLPRRVAGVASASATTALGAVAALVDLGGDDVYVSGDSSQAFANGPGALAILLDASGDDDYAALAGSQGYAVGGGGAYFLDLAGDDRYASPSQAIVAGPRDDADALAVLVNSSATASLRTLEEARAPGRVAVFLDANGTDAYDRVGVPTEAGDVDAYQGRSTWRASLASDATNTSTAAFLDLDGTDAYRVVDAVTRAPIDVSGAKNDRVRVTPVDRADAARVDVFVDASLLQGGTVSDRDRDGAPDAAEAAAGTSSTNATEAPAGTEGGFLLRLPNWGVLVGADGANAYRAGAEAALLVDVGGPDAYAGHVGASTPRWPVALALDLGGDDAYASNGTIPLSGFRPTHETNAQPTTSAGSTGTTEFNSVAGPAVSLIAPGDGLSAWALRAYTDLLVGSSQGAGVLGIGVLRDAAGTDRFETRLAARTCDECARDARLLGAAQGAGVLGVGILHAGGDATFVVNVTAEGEDLTTNPRPVVARTLAQGAAVAGAGFLFADGEAARNAYLLESSSRGIGATNATTGQGYGGFVGVGVLRDAGGGSVLEATALAQGAGDGLAAGTAFIPLGVTLATSPAMGLLLLEGPGNDRLRAVERAQAYAVQHSVGILVDADGDDDRALAKGAGQAHAATGTAVLLDKRGNDVTSANGTLAQGASRGGMALFLDESGGDQYVAPSQGMGFASPDSPVSAVGILLDLRGDDAYRLTRPSEPGQGGVLAAGGSTGLALFADLAGFDSHPPFVFGHNQVSSLAPPRGGNDHQWQGGNAALQAVGMDRETAGVLTKSLWTALGLAGTGVDFTLHPGPGTAADPLKGVVGLRGNVRAGNRAVGSEAIDRFEYRVDGRLVATTPNGVASWSTDLVADGRRVVPDGTYTLELQGYPARTPGATAAEGEPMRASKTVSVDNPPLSHAPEAAAVATTQRPIQVRFFVDRDLEAGAGCPACATLKLAPGPLDWGAPRVEDPHGILLNDPCTTAACFPAVTAVAASGDVYLRWTPPTSGDLPVGYRIFRSTSADGVETLAPVGYVDARMPLRFVDEGAPFPLAYAVAPIRAHGGAVQMSNPALTPGGGRTLTLSDSAAPAPADGLVARGVQGGVVLAWQPAKAATSYVVQRAFADAPDSAFATLATSPTTSYVDATGWPDVDYRYRVVARSVADSPIPSNVARARAAPGENVTLAAIDEAGGAIPLVEGPFGGGQTHTLLVDASGLPDGRYVLNLTHADARGAVSWGNASILLDGTPPTSGVAAGPWLGGSLNRGGLLRLPVRAFDATAGPLSTSVHVSVDGGAWRSLKTIDWATAPDVTGADGENATTVLLPNVVDGARVRVLVATADRAGNVEGATGLPWAPTLDDGVASLLRAGAFSEHVVDTTAPSAPDGSMDVAVRPGTVVTFHVEPRERGSGIATAVLQVGPHEAPLVRESNGSYVARWTATGECRCQAVAVVTDHAGNVGVISLGEVTVDATPPRVDQADVVFAGGRAMGRPGEPATIRVLASDALSLPDALVVDADLGPASTRGATRLAWSEKDARHVAAFPTDRLDEAGRTLLPVRVTDRAGNVATGLVPVTVDGASIGLRDVRLGNVTPDGATFAWTTAAPARGRVEYGESPQLSGATPLGPATREHVFTLTGLRPGAHYYARAVAVSDAGVETASPLMEFDTAPALAVRLSPIEGAPDSKGPVRLQVDVQRFDGRVVDADLEIRVVPPRGDERVMGVARAEDGTGNVSFDLGDQRDGDYGVRLVARAGEETGESPLLRVVLDRTAPLVAVAKDVVLLPGKPLNISAIDRGSGVDLTRIRVALDGAALAAYEDEGGLHVMVPQANASRLAELVATVPDRAGNAQTLRATLQLDASPPVIRNASVRAVEGHARATPGGSAVLTLDVEDLTLRRVQAALPSAVGGAVVELASRNGRTYAYTFDVPAGARDGESVVRVRAVDAAGATTEALLDLVVDSTPPQVHDVALVATSPTSAKVAFRTSEPTVAEATAPGLDEASRARQEKALSVHELALAGLRPGADVNVTLRVTDQAGHETVTVVRGATPPDVVAPGRVPGLAAQDLGDGLVSLSWRNATDDVGVREYRVTRWALGSSASTTTRASPALVESPVGAPVRLSVVALDHAGNEGPAESVDVVSHARPHLSNGTVDPPTGGPGTYTFRVDLRHRDARLPDVSVVVDGVSHRMQPLPGDCAATCTLEARVPLSADTFADGPHRFTFVADEGVFRVAFPERGNLSGPLVMADGASPERGIRGASDVPLPSAAAALVAVALGALVLRRRLLR